MQAEVQIAEEARRLGFDAVAIARADLPLEADFARYEAFLASGMHASMDWLARAPETRRRLDGDAILPGARSVICLARRYGRSAEEENAEAPVARAIARYARGRDYHNGVRKKLRALCKFVRRFGTDEAPVAARPLCDQEPVLERAWAARSGLGFVGKNGLLIVPGVGSLVLLGEVVTTLPLEPGAPVPERCGSCTRCLDACPTSAFAAPWVLDPRRCVAFLTIENRAGVPEELRGGVGEHLFGCDDCQTACPFNAGIRGRPTREGAVDERFAADPRWSTVEVRDLLALDDDGFAALRTGSPVGRATRKGLARNAALVLGNRAAAAGHAPDDEAALRVAREHHDEPFVREAASWALGRDQHR
ncbi:MAG: Epoxyqueuosine (oQ) reductase QueG [Labilithrix sp.]|nr:Epoxyqueuosine (oQ) reductase QueG [Labilithrix sp.]